MALALLSGETSFPAVKSWDALKHGNSLHCSGDDVES